MRAELIRELREIVGGKGLVVEPARLLSWESDALPRFRQIPEAVVLPANTDEAARAVEVLVREGVPLTPRGSGTGLAGGAVAAPGGVLVGTSRMDRILELDPDRRLARVQAGVINAELSRAAAPFGLRYAPDPSSQTACTLGGNVGANAGGPHCLKYGVTTRYVTGLTVVTGSGEVVELGGAGRCSPGMDLLGLFVGSEGRLGLATEIEVRLLPVPRGVRTLLAVFGDVEAAGTAVSRIIAQGLVPAALEIMDRGTIQAVEASVFAAGYPTDAGAVLVVEFDGTEAGLDAEAARSEALCREAGATEVRRARDEAERQALWQGRKKAYGAFGRITPDLMVQDATVPRSTLPAVLHRIGEIGERHELRVANVFHAGDGNLHPKILFDRRDTELVERVERASREMMEACVAAGGTITGEHGVGQDKRGYMSLVHGPGELAAMERLQQAFDPRGIWNPGKVLPDGHGEGRAASAGPRASALSSPSASPSSPSIRHSPADLTVQVDGDVTLGELQEALSSKGQWLPTDPPGGPGLTVREWVESGAWGALAPWAGLTRDLVLGVDVESLAGQRLRFGGQVMKNVAGFDMVRGVVGGRGRWGRLVSATLRLLAIPRAHKILSWEGADPVLAELAGEVAGHPVLPASLVRLGGRDRPALFMRLLGSEATVEAEALELLERFPGGKAWSRVPEGSGFLGADPLGRALAREDVGHVVEIRRGAADREVVESAVRTLPGAPLPFHHLPLWDVWRITLDTESFPAAEAAAIPPALEALAGRLRGEGGDVAVIREAGGNSAWSLPVAPWCPARELEGRVGAVLDAETPAGVESQ